MDDLLYVKYVTEPPLGPLCPRVCGMSTVKTVGDGGLLLLPENEYNGHLNHCLLAGIAYPFWCDCLEYMEGGPWVA